MANNGIQHEGSRELQLLHHIYSHPNLDTVRNNPAKVIALIDDFSQAHYSMNIGSLKGKVVTDLIASLKPTTMVELGCYVGYSAILFGDAARRAGGERYISLELNPEFAAIANMLIELAGLRDFVTVIVGRSDLSLQKLHDSGDVKQIDLLFIDHYKPAYTTDLKLCEHHGLIRPGSVLAADNVIYPGNPPYLEYVRASVQEKREVAKKGPTGAYNVEGIPERQVKAFFGDSYRPSFDVVGNPNLVYESVLEQPEGSRDGVEVTRCVGIADVE